MLPADSGTCELVSPVTQRAPAVPTRAFGRNACCGLLRQLQARAYLQSDSLAGSPVGRPQVTKLKDIEFCKGWAFKVRQLGNWATWDCSLGRMPRRGKPETQRQRQLQQSIPVFLILAFVAAYMFVPTSWVSGQAALSWRPG